MSGQETLCHKKFLRIPKANFLGKRKTHQRNSLWNSSQNSIAIPGADSGSGFPDPLPPNLKNLGSAKFQTIAQDVSYLTPSSPRSKVIFGTSGSQIDFFAIGLINLSDLPLGIAKTP